MKLLLFEYITGGGFNAQPLPSSLLQEGVGMLQALLADCQRLPELSVRVLLESRCQNLAADYPVEIMVVTPAQDVMQQLQHALPWADAVWIIAPESEGRLHALCRIVEAAGKPLLTSNSSAVALTTDKWQTNLCLQAHKLPVVPTALLVEIKHYTEGTWILKPIDGVGCTNTWCVSNQAELEVVVSQLDNPQNYLLQPFITGQPASLSCLFADREAKILCVNQQIVILHDQQFKWQDSKVDTLPMSAEYQHWVDTLAQAIPGLYGYVGIDFILGIEANWILEINPRLTSSYVGIYDTVGVNVVAEVLQRNRLRIFFDSLP